MQSIATQAHFLKVTSLQTWVPVHIISSYTKISSKQLLTLAFECKDYYHNLYPTTSGQRAFELKELLTDAHCLL